MSDYISREDAIRELEFRCKILKVRGGETAANILTRYGIKELRNKDALPAADVRPVVWGRWTRIDYAPCGHDYKCSTCGWKNEMATNFCPNCGADMREDRK